MRSKYLLTCRNCQKHTKSLHGKYKDLCWNCYINSSPMCRKIGNSNRTSLKDALNKIYEVKKYSSSSGCTCSFPNALEGIKFKIQVIDGD